MKKVAILVYSIIAFTVISYGQTYNWADNLDSSKHLISVNAGLEYSTIAGMYYGYKLPGKTPLVLQVGISAPFGNNVLDDFKSKIGLGGLVWSKKSFKTIFALNGVYKQYASELVRLSNMGVEFHSEFGVYKQKWFVSGEVGLELSLTTHFKHSETYKEIIYSDVKDGWYKPVSAGFMNFGLQTGYSVGRSDIIFRIGFIQSVSSKVNALIPYYTTIGYNCKIK